MAGWGGVGGRLVFVNSESPFTVRTTNEAKREKLQFRTFVSGQHWNESFLFSCKNIRNLRCGKAASAATCLCAKNRRGKNPSRNCKLPFILQLTGTFPSNNFNKEMPPAILPISLNITQALYTLFPWVYTPLLLNCGKFHARTYTSD